MYVIDITRDNKSTDILCGNDSMETKNKILDYVIEYTFANYNILISKENLDKYLNINSFSLNKFLNEVYSISIEKDLIIQSFITDKDNCLFVKYLDEKTDIPTLYTFNKKDKDVAQAILTFLVNDRLIDKYKDDLTEYNKRKLNYNQKNINYTNSSENIKCEIISLYDYNGMFIEELLNNTCSFNQIKTNLKINI